MDAPAPPRGPAGLHLAASRKAESTLTQEPGEHFGAILAACGLAAIVSAGFLVHRALGFLLLGLVLLVVGGHLVGAPKRAATVAPPPPGGGGLGPPGPPDRGSRGK